MKKTYNKQCKIHNKNLPVMQEMQEYVTYNQEENYSIEIGTKKKKKGDKISRQGHKNRHYK